MSNENFRKIFEVEYEEINSNWEMKYSRFLSLSDAKKFAKHILKKDRQTAVRIHEITQDKINFGFIKRWNDTQDILIMDCHEEDYKKVLHI